MTRKCTETDFRGFLDNYDRYEEGKGYNVFRLAVDHLCEKF